MQLTINRIDTASFSDKLATHLNETFHFACLELVSLGADFRPIFDQACVITIAAGMETRKFYDAHLHQHVEALFYSVCFLALVAIACIASTVVAIFKVVAPIVREQWAIQMEDFRRFHEAVSNPLAQDLQRQDDLIAWFDQYR